MPAIGNSCDKAKDRKQAVEWKTKKTEFWQQVVFGIKEHALLKEIDDKDQRKCRCTRMAWGEWSLWNPCVLPMSCTRVFANVCSPIRFTQSQCIRFAHCKKIRPQSKIFLKCIKVNIQYLPADMTFQVVENSGCNPKRQNIIQIRKCHKSNDMHQRERIKEFFVYQHCRQSKNAQWTS